MISRQRPSDQVVVQESIPATGTVRRLPPPITVTVVLPIDDHNRVTDALPPTTGGLGEHDPAPNGTSPSHPATAGLASTRRTITNLTRSLVNVQVRLKKSLNRAPPESPISVLIQHAITRFEPYKTEVLALRGPQAEETIDLMQKMLDKNSCGDDMPILKCNHRVELRHLLVRLSKAAGVLPASIFLKDVECWDRDSVAGGGFADIFRATHLGQQVALKRLRVFLSSKEETASYNATFCREALVWKQLFHPHVLSFLGVDCDTFRPYLCMVSPWMTSGNIMDCLKRLVSEGQCLPLDRWIREIIEGLQYLHSETIVHGDLRGANILIDGHLRVQLADFGLAQFADTSTASLGSHPGGAVRWLAPEVLKGGRSSFASDIYAFGCVCLEVYTRKHPFAEIANDTQVVARILHGTRPKKPSPEGPSSRGLWDLVERCWLEDPTDRPDARFIANSLPVDNNSEFIASDYDIIFDSGVQDRPTTESSPKMAASDLSMVHDLLGSPESVAPQDRPWSPFSLLSSPTSLTSITSGASKPVVRSSNSSYISVSHSRSQGAFPSLSSSLSAHSGVIREVGLVKSPSQEWPDRRHFASKDYAFFVPDDIEEEGSDADDHPHNGALSSDLRNASSSSDPSQPPPCFPPLDLPFEPLDPPAEDLEPQRRPTLEDILIEDPLSQLKHQIAVTTAMDLL